MAILNCPFRAIENIDANWKNILKYFEIQI